MSIKNCKYCIHCEYEFSDRYFYCYKDTAQYGKKYDSKIGNECRDFCFDNPELRNELIHEQETNV